MAYIHKSAFHSHGDLTSSRCLVDNRWTLKVACIALPAFRGEEGGREGGEGGVQGRNIWLACMQTCDISLVKRVVLDCSDEQPELCIVHTR